MNIKFDPGDRVFWYDESYQIRSGIVESVDISKKKRIVYSLALTSLTNNSDLGKSWTPEIGESELFFRKETMLAEIILRTTPWKCDKTTLQGAVETAEEICETLKRMLTEEERGVKQ